VDEEHDFTFVLFPGSLAWGGVGLMHSTGLALVVGLDKFKRNPEPCNIMVEVCISMCESVCSTALDNTGLRQH
jgi:hypothetical protein